MGDERTGFTERVRQELSSTPVGGTASARSELAALLHLGARLHLRGNVEDADRLRIELSTPSGAVARRAFSLLTLLRSERPVLRVRAPGGVRSRSTYGLIIELGAAEVASDVGLLDADGHPARGFPADVAADPVGAVAVVRGAFLAAGSVSRPGGAPHLELRAPNEVVASALAELIGAVAGGSASVTGDDPVRVVVKSGEAIGALLAAMGATNAFLEWEEQRLRRSLRSAANRLANADAANLRRTIEAAAAQTRAVERAVERVGWEDLDDDLRSVALARIANPTANLAELGALCDPPLSKSGVHRRLQRLESLATEG